MKPRTRGYAIIFNLPSFADLGTPKTVKDKGVESDKETVNNDAEDADNITVYNEIKKGLIKRGIPAV